MKVYEIGNTETSNGAEMFLTKKAFINRANYHLQNYSRFHGLSFNSAKTYEEACDFLNESNYTTKEYSHGTSILEWNSESMYPSMILDENGNSIGKETCQR